MKHSLVLSLAFFFLGGLVPSSYALLQQSPTAARKPSLGVTIHGVVVSETDDGSPAKAAGLKPNDVIMKFDGRPVSDLNDLVEQLQSVAPSQKIAVVLRRGGKEIEATISFASSFGEDGPRLGITPVLGVRVQEVRPDTAASRAGMKDDDVIVSWDGDPIESYDDLIAHIAKSAAAGRAVVTVLRAGSNQKINVDFRGAERRPVGKAPVPDKVPGLLDGFQTQSLVEAIAALGDLENAQKELAQGIEMLEKAKTPEATAKALEHLKNGKARVDAVASIVSQLRKTTDSLRRLYDQLKDSFHESGFELFNTHPDADVMERISELMSEGKSTAEIREIIAAEFPGVEVIVQDEDRPATSRPTKR